MRRRGLVRFQETLRHWQQFQGLGRELLGVKWKPKGGPLAGEVKDGIVYLYESNEELAMATLRHEVLDYELGRILEPYRRITNKLISLINEDAYGKKEELVQKLIPILEKDD